MATILNDSVGLDGSILNGRGGSNELLVGLLLSRLFGHDGHGSNGHGQRAIDLAIGAIDGKVDCIKELAQQANCSIGRVHDSICDLKSQVSEVKTHMSDKTCEIKDFVLNRMEHKEEKDSFRHEFIKKEFCDLRHENEKMHFETRLDLERAENRITKTIDCKHDAVMKEFCDLKFREEQREKEFWKAKAQESEKCRDREAADRNVQIIGSDIITTVTNLLSNNKAG